MCFTSGTLFAVILAVGAPLEYVLFAGAACALIIVPFLAVVQRQQRRSARPHKGRRKDAARFSRSRYAYWLLIGIAVVATVGAYFVVDPFFTTGRRGAAAILGVIIAPIFAVSVFYDPLAGLIDRWLDRRATGSSASDVPGEDAQSEPVEPRR